MLRNRRIALADKPWWLAGGIPRQNCVAAWQAVGASDYAASKVNLANPGIYGLADAATAPTWSTDVGWTMGDGWLTSTLTIDIKPLTYIAKYAQDTITGAQTILGGNENGGYSFDNNAGIQRLLKQGVALIGAATVAITADTDYVLAVTYSAASDWVHYKNGVINGSGNSAQTAVAGKTLQVARQYNTGQKMTGWVKAIAIYNIDLTGMQIVALTNAMNNL